MAQSHQKVIFSLKRGVKNFFTLGKGGHSGEKPKILYKEYILSVTIFSDHLPLCGYPCLSTPGLGSYSKATALQ